MKFVLLLALFVATVAAVPAGKRSRHAQVSPIVMPEPATPEVAEELPIPQATFGEVFNNGNVQVSVNAPSELNETSMLQTLQSWFNMVLNYVSDGVESSKQII